MSRTISPALDAEDIEKALEVILEHSGKPLGELFAGVPDKATRNERIQAAVRRHQYRLQGVGDHLGLCCSTISGIAKRIAESIKP